MSLPIHPSFLASTLADSHWPVFLSVLCINALVLHEEWGILLDIDFFLSIFLLQLLHVPWGLFSHYLCFSSPVLFPQQHEVGYLELSRWQLFEFPLLQLLRKGEVTEKFPAVSSSLQGTLSSLNSQAALQQVRTSVALQGMFPVVVVWSADRELSCLEASVERDSCVLWLA